MSKHREPRTGKREPSQGTRVGTARLAIVGAVLAAATLLLYAPVGRHPFIHYDDNLYLFDNLHVQSGLTRAGVTWAFTTGHSANWHPVTWLSHMLDCQLFGLDPGRHHLMSAALHALTAVLILLVFTSATGAMWRSAIVAAVFALHPLHVESVAWAAERKDVLSGLFGILTVAAYLRYVRCGGVPSYLLALLCFALGLMSKPMLVSLPCVLLLLDVWPLARLRLPGSGGPDRSGRRPAAERPAPSATRVVIEKLPFFALSIASSVITFQAQRSGGALVSLQMVSPGQRIGNALVSYLSYIRKALWPSDLSIFYPRSVKPAWEIAAAALVLAGLSLAAFRAARRRPYLAVGWLWFLGTLVPVIGLVQVGIQSMADRYMYLPLVGLSIIAAWGVPDLMARRRRSQTLLALAAAATLAGFTVVTWRQIGLWSDDYTLFRHAMTVTRDNFVAHTNVGVALQLQGKLDEAISQYRVAEGIYPTYEIMHYNLGLALAQQGKNDSALVHLAEAVRLRPSYLDARNNLGIVLALQGRTREAGEQFREVLKIEPDHWKAHYNLGLVLAQEGRLDASIAEYQQSLRLKPDDADARASLARALEVKKAVGTPSAP